MATESELIAASEAIQEGLWLLRLGEVIGTKAPIQMYIDNKAAIDIANSKGLTRQVKHIEICDAYVQILQERGVVSITHMMSNRNRSDVLTKAFQNLGAFVHARNMLFRQDSECPQAVGECCSKTSSGHLVHEHQKTFG